MKVKEWKNKVIFLYNVVEGNANQSYGIHVADLAGIPEKVLIRAKTILQNFEKKYKEDLDVKKTNNSDSNIEVSTRFLDLINEISVLDPNSLSPKQALELMYDFVNRVEKINRKKED